MNVVIDINTAKNELYNKRKEARFKELETEKPSADYLLFCLLVIIACSVLISMLLFILLLAAGGFCDYLHVTKEAENIIDNHFLAILICLSIIVAAIIGCWVFINERNDYKELKQICTQYENYDYEKIPDLVKTSAYKDLCVLEKLQNQSVQFLNLTKYNTYIVVTYSENGKVHEHFFKDCKTEKRTDIEETTLSWEDEQVVCKFKYH